MAGDRLTPLDATFLQLEEADDAAHMHIGTVMIFEPRGSRPPTLRLVRRHFEDRTAALPRYRQRLSQPHTGGLHWPTWVADAGFDIERHVGHVRLPAPAGEAELRTWAGEYWSTRLDRTRPLWDARLLTGLEGGRWAVALKVHHALVDGIGMVDAAYLLLDATRRPRRPSERSASPQAESAPGPVDRVRAAVHGGLNAARHPERLRDALLQAAAAAEVLIRDEVMSAPRCSLNAPISRERVYRVVRADLSELKGVKNAMGGTVNDAILAAVTGGLRELLAARREQPPDPGLRAMVPVNLRTAAQRFGAGNEVSSLFVHLPVAEPDPRCRYQLISASMADLKRGESVAGAAQLITLGGLAPPVLHAVFARSVFATRLFNLTVTNVPGPQVPLYGLGARLEEVWPLVPLAADHSVGVAVVSYNGEVFFGLSGDARRAPDLDVLAVGVESAIAELVEVAATARDTRVPGPIAS